MLIRTVTVVILFSNAVAATEIIEPAGLDHIKEIITTDERLNKKVTPEKIDEAMIAIDKMNVLIKEAVKAQGLANDGAVSVTDTRAINTYLVEHYASTWHQLRGDYSSGNASG